MQEALGPTGLSKVTWLRGSRGKGVECVGVKSGSARAAARGVRDRNLLCRLAHDHAVCESVRRFLV